MTKLNIGKALIIGGLIVASLGAQASGFRKTTTYPGMVITPAKFYEIVEITQPNKVAEMFGTPDSINSMHDTSGAVTGVVWVYHNAVAKQDKKMDANFVLVNGEMKYVTLSSGG